MDVSKTAKIFAVALSAASCTASTSIAQSNDQILNLVHCSTIYSLNASSLFIKMGNSESSVAAGKKGIAFYNTAKNYAKNAGWADAQMSSVMNFEIEKSKAMAVNFDQQYIQAVAQEISKCEDFRKLPAIASEWDTQFRLVQK